jgi:hypothetical protein
MIDDPGMCTALWNLVRSNDGCSHFERRLTMEKQPTENITIPMWRYDLFVKAEAMLELAKKIHRNSDQYEAKKNLMIVFDAEKEPCETI